MLEVKCTHDFGAKSAAGQFVQGANYAVNDAIVVALQEGEMAWKGLRLEDEHREKQHMRDKRNNIRGPAGAGPEQRRGCRY